MLRKTYQLEKYQNIKKCDVSCMTESTDILLDLYNNNNTNNNNITTATTTPTTLLTQNLQTIVEERSGDISSVSAPISAQTTAPNSPTENNFPKSLQQFQLAISQDTINQLEVRFYVLKLLKIFAAIIKKILCGLN